MEVPYWQFAGVTYDHVTGKLVTYVNGEKVGVIQACNILHHLLFYQGI